MGEKPTGQFLPPALSVSNHLLTLTYFMIYHHLFHVIKLDLPRGGGAGWGLCEGGGGRNQLVSFFSHPPPPLTPPVKVLCGNDKLF